MGKKSDAKKATKSEKLAREAGKVAARAETAAREAVDRATRATGLLVSFLGKPGEVVAGGIGSALNVGQDALGTVGAGVGRLLGPGEKETDVETLDVRLQQALAELGVPTRAEIAALEARLEALEAGQKRRTTRAKQPANGKRASTKSGSKTASGPRAKAAPVRRAKRAAAAPPEVVSGKETPAPAE